MKIESGTGNGKEAKVDDLNRLHTLTISKTDLQRAVEDGDAYNINTGDIAISAETAMLYLKNNEDKDLYIEAIAVGIGGSANFNATGNCIVTVVKNPTGGTTISNASAVAMNQNRNFGSSKTLTADAYKAAASGNTVTGGSDVLKIAQNGRGRVYAGIGLLLKKGNSIGIEVDPNLSSGSTNVYAAIICNLVEIV